jgi:hypothetical protein
MNFDQKNVLNINIPSIHLFASRIMSLVDSHAYSPHIYAEYFRFPTRDFPAPFNIKVAHPAMSCHANQHLNLPAENATST